MVSVEEEAAFFRKEVLVVGQAPMDGHTPRSIQETQAGVCGLFRRSWVDRRAKGNWEGLERGVGVKIIKRCCKKFSRDWKYFKCTLRTEITGFCSDRLFRTPGMLSHNMALPSPPPGPSYNAILLPPYLFVQLLPPSSWFFSESFLSFQHGNPFPSGMPSPGNSPHIDLQRCLLCLNRATWSQPSESPASMSAG